MKIKNLFHKKSVLTFSERLIIYRYAKYVFLNYSDCDYMCSAIKISIEFNKPELSSIDINHTNFPELFNKKPHNNSYLPWWHKSNREIRVQKFNEIITEMTNKLIKPKWYDKLK